MSLLRRQCISSCYFLLVTVGQSLLHYFHVLRAASSNRPLVPRPLHQHKSLVTHVLHMLLAVQRHSLSYPHAHKLSHLKLPYLCMNELAMKHGLLVVGLPLALAMVVALPEVVSNRLNHYPVQHHPQCVTRIICLAHSDLKHQHDFISCAAVLDQTVADFCFVRCSVAGQMMGNDSISW